MPGNAERLKALENVILMTSDSENVLTAVVAGVAVEEAVALIHVDQDHGLLHHIVETRDRLRDEEEGHHPEVHRHAAIETCMSLEDERAGGQTMVGIGQFRDRHQLVAMGTVQVLVVEVREMEGQWVDQSLVLCHVLCLALSVARHHGHARLRVDENPLVDCQDHLREVDRLGGSAEGQGQGHQAKVLVAAGVEARVEA